MFQHLIVPVDGSSASFDAVRVASRMAAAVDGRLDVVTVVQARGGRAAAASTLQRGIDRCRPLPIEPLPCVLTADSVASAVGRLVESTPGAAVLMSSHGHARSAAVLGSTTDEILREIFGPVIVVGPHCDVDRAGSLAGTYVVPLDGSPSADGVLPIVAAWSVEFGGTAWLVEVIGGADRYGVDVVESAYVSRRATELRHRIDRPVEYEMLHGSHPARSIVAYSVAEGASLIILATHGRTRLSRLRSGSVAAAVVRHSPCPVVMFRPPALSPVATAAGTEPTPTDVTVADSPPEWSRAFVEQSVAL